MEVSTEKCFTAPSGKCSHLETLSLAVVTAIIKQSSRIWCGHCSRSVELSSWHSTQMNRAGQLSRRIELAAICPSPQMCGRVKLALWDHRKANIKVWTWIHARACSRPCTASLWSLQVWVPSTHGMGTAICGLPVPQAAWTTSQIMLETQQTSKMAPGANCKQADATE